MLAKRIIPCLDVKNGKTVKGVNFENFRDAGDPVELGRRYSDEGADELVFLDITASLEGRDTFVNVVRRVAENLNIPFTVGGGFTVACQLQCTAHPYFVWYFGHGIGVETKLIFGTSLM